MDGEITPKAFAHNSARDSLSPKRSPLVLKEDECAWARQLIQLSRDDHLDEQEYVVTNVKPIRQDVVASRIESEEGTTEEKSHDTSFQDATSLVAEQQRPNISTSTTSASDMAKEASPRFVPPPPRHRPYELELDDSRGATSISVAELRSLITSAESRPQHAVPSLQTIDHTTLLSPVLAKGRKKYPRPILSSRQPVCQAPQTSTDSSSMGNQPSRPHRNDHGRSQSAVFTSGGAEEDSSTSSQDHVFKASRKPSINMLKKKSTRAVPNGFTATFIEVPRAATAPNLDANDSAEDEWQDEEVYAKEKSKNTHHSKTMSAPSPVLLSQPASPVTITEERAARPLSAGTTITGRSMRNELDENASPYHQRISALSPTIPTPSPIPEDSPHQYGLKDSTETPSPLEVSKMKRRSNGIEIFNEAKSLQSAASFLNGLSNARRRAESRTRQRSTTQSTTVTSFANVSTSTLPLNGAYSSSHLASAHDLAATEISDPGSRPITPKIDDISRTLGHGNKSSGFAYAKALSLVQLKCYRNHERLLRSGNKNYPVECAVCHQDDDQPYYWSCSWCAIRMCNDCRASLRQNGMNGIWDKIREAELGAQCS